MKSNETKHESFMGRAQPRLWSLLTAGFAVLLAGMLFTCGGADKNILRKYSKTTADEKAKEALDSRDYDTAIADYTKLVADDPTGYWRYPLLSAAYSGKAGVDILTLIKKQLAGGSKSVNLLTDLAGFLPADTSDESKTWLAKAQETLQAMPAEFITAGGAYDYAAGAASQLGLIQGLLAAIIVNKYAVLDASGAVDRTKLDTMSEAEVTEFLGVLGNMAQTNSGGSLSDKMKVSAQSALDKIAATPGATDKERVLNYIAATKGKPTDTPTATDTSTATDTATVTDTSTLTVTTTTTATATDTATH